MTYEVRAQTGSAIDSLILPVTINVSSGAAGTIQASATYAPTTLESTSAIPDFADTSSPTALANLLSCLPPTHLAFVSQPVNTMAGTVQPPISVEALDVFGNLTSSSSQVTLTSTPPGVNVSASAVSGIATFNVLVFENPGIYTLTASAPGLARVTSNSVTMSGPSTISVSSLPGTARFGQSVTLIATMSPASATGQVAFLDGSAMLGTATLSNGQAQLTTTALTAGTHNLRARYGGNAVFTGSVSQVIFENVNAVAANALLPAVNYTVGQGPKFIAAADLNHDGIPDLVVVNSAAASIAVMLGKGDGTFQAPAYYAAGSQPVAATIGDLNNDGKPDLVVANSTDGSVSVLLGRGDGTFQPEVAYSAGSNPFSVAIGDFNNDAIPDLAVANSAGNGQVSILLGNDDGTFQSAVAYSVGSSPTSIAAGDFNGDGNADLVVANRDSNSVAYLYGLGDGTFFPAFYYPAGNEPISLVVADFNNDFNADLAVADLTGNTVTVLAFGTSFVGAFPAGNGPNSVAVGDFNGDGKLDLVVANVNSGGVSVLFGTGDGTFSSPTSYVSGFSSESVVVADFNGDGVTDIAVANFGSNNISVLLGAGIPSFNISGKVTLAAVGQSGVTVGLSPQGTFTNTDIAGNYSFTGLAPGGNFTVTPTLAGYTFSPVSQAFSNLAANQTANFTASPTGNDVVVSGAVAVGGAGRSGVTINVTGSTATSTFTDSSGNYAIVLQKGGTYTLSAALAGYSFTPPVTFANLNANHTANFTGTAATNNCVGLFSTSINLACSAMSQSAFQGNPAVSIGSQTNYFGAMTLVGNVPFSDAAGMALYNAGGGGGASVSLDLYNTSFNGGIPQAKIKAIDDGNYSDRLTFWTKTPGSPGNALTEKLRITSTGNVGIGTTTPTLGPLQMGSGAFVSAGGVWTNASDRNLKENFLPTTPAAILEKIDALPLTEWNYKNEDPSIRHVGPVAQDFFNIFGVGNSATSISTIDPSGIALAGIQGLDQKSQSRAARLAAFKRQLAQKTEELRQLQERLAHLESLLDQIKSGANIR